MKRVSQYGSRSLFLIFFLFILLTGCAPVISQNLRTQADLTLTFEQVFQNPEAYKGKFVIWGGEIIETVNQKDKTSLIEVLERPLNRREEPNRMGRSPGRFLVRAEGYLDPYIFRRGRGITVAGKMMGEKTRPLGEMEYRYPLLLSKQIYLWGSRYYYYYPPPYYSYYPWGWWGYPYWW